MEKSTYAQKVFCPKIFFPLKNVFFHLKEISIPVCKLFNDFFIDMIVWNHISHFSDLFLIILIIDGIYGVCASTQHVVSLEFS